MNLLRSHSRVKNILHFSGAFRSTSATRFASTTLRISGITFASMYFFCESCSDGPNFDRLGKSSCAIVSIAAPNVSDVCTICCPIYNVVSTFASRYAHRLLHHLDSL